MKGYYLIQISQPSTTTVFLMVTTIGALFLLLRLSSQTTPESSGDFPTPGDILAASDIVTTGDILTSGDNAASGYCDDNEVMMECGPLCEPTCMVPNPECDEDCAVDVCRCKEGFIRSKPDGACIEASACPPG
ncbi:trypsin Inhibitor like cysteine rich domain protein [Ancylostoma duodenale]|uniref:Trypsin Inhibitor like cysteine rich domain protein n=1 Tax=Ancylostoma duodenale TaxID=51022 RepID=A0A0C2FQD6_9BILA|nr:trypsin Inhibitor like cysteine rich domain protein [Ancylostoma duodenale]